MRRDAIRRSGPGFGQGRRAVAANGEMSPQIRHPIGHPHRRPSIPGSGLIDKGVVLEADAGIIEAGKATDLLIMDRAQHAPGKTILEPVELGNLPGVGMTIVDGTVRPGRSRNAPPTTILPGQVQV